MRARPARFATAIVLSWLPAMVAAAPAETPAPTHRIEFETDEVTRPELAVSPDGEWLVFTMLGHLFQLPAEGGTARQLTYGPHYDSDPAVSPDGSKVAFVSDRNGDEPNLFVLDLREGRIDQVTSEAWVSRPVWRPDGRAIAFLSVLGPRERCPINRSLVRLVSLADDRLERVTESPLAIRSLFYLPDGRLAWTVYEGDPHEGPGATRIEVAEAAGEATTIRSLEGMWNRIVPNPRGDGYVGSVRRYLPHHGFFGQPTDLLFLSNADEPVRHLATLGGPYCFPEDSRPAVPADGEMVYVADAGRLLRIDLATGTRKRISLRARPRIEVHLPLEAPTLELANPGGVVRPSSILDPRLSPDGQTLVFVAFGELWEQPLAGGEARRLLPGSGLARNPAFSPDGTRLAFVHSEYGTKRVRILDLTSGAVRTIGPGPSYGHPSWSPDGRRLVVGGNREYRYQLLELDTEEGGETILASASPRYWLPRPHFSADGSALYFTDDSTGKPLLYRLLLRQGAEAEALTQPLEQYREGLVTADGRQLVYRRNSEIWVVRLDSGIPSQTDVRRLSREGGAGFSLTADGAVVYSHGDRVWRQPLNGGPREPIPIRLSLEVAEPRPLLIQRVRLLDLPRGRFGPETSLFVRGGRIEWIGSERGRAIPEETIVLDGMGSYAVPGLFDMHVHVESSWYATDVYQEAFLAYGVTSVRDMGEPLPWVKALQDRSKTARAVPRYFYSGDGFESSQPGRGGWGLGIRSEDEAREYVRSWRRQGVHFIKTHPPISWPVRRAVVDEARRLGLPVAGHAAIIEELTRSVVWGHTFIEHAGGPGGRVYDDVLQLLASAGTRWDPTLMLMGVGIVWAREEPERWDDPKLRAFVPEEVRKVVTSLAWSGVDARALRGLWYEQLAQIRDAHRRGVKLHLGTDAQFWEMTYPGSSLHMEMELFHQAGLTPLEVLRLATIEAATALGVQDDLGSLEVGKLADIVLLNADPLMDIRATQAIRRVIKDGRVFDPEDLAPAEGATSQ